MAGNWSKIIEAQCIHYSRFMSKLDHGQANFLFWFLFSFVLVLLVLSALQYMRLLSFKNDSDNGVLACDQARQHRKLRLLRLNLGIVIVAFFLATIAVVLECFCLFNIEFCQGEDLTQLYWGVWSVLQLGSLIAILGVALHFWITLSTIETPGWAIALGTPVLVFAAIGWILSHFGHKFWLRCFHGRIRKTRRRAGNDNESEVDGYGGVNGISLTVRDAEGNRDAEGEGVRDHNCEGRFQRNANREGNFHKNTNGESDSHRNANGESNVYSSGEVQVQVQAQAQAQLPVHVDVGVQTAVQVQVEGEVETEVAVQEEAEANESKSKTEANQKGECGCKCDCKGKNENKAEARRKESL